MPRRTKGDVLLFSSKFTEEEIEQIASEHNEGIPLDDILQYRKDVEFNNFLGKIHLAERGGGMCCIAFLDKSQSNGYFYHCFEELVVKEYLSGADFKVVMNWINIHLIYKDHILTVFPLTPEGLMLYRTMMQHPKYTDPEEQRLYMGKYIRGNKNLYGHGCKLYNSRFKPFGEK